MKISSRDPGLKYDFFLKAVAVKLAGHIYRAYGSVFKLVEFYYTRKLMLQEINLMYKPKNYY